MRGFVNFKAPERELFYYVKYSSEKVYTKFNKKLR